IADGHLCDEGSDRLYTEQVVRLPGNYACYAPQEQIDVGPPPCLRTGAVTFGCFNKLAKLNERVAPLWAGILAGVPGSRLLLKDHALTDSSVQEYYRDLFARHGVARERILFEGQSTHEAYLEAYNRVDVALDPFPFNGGMTTIEALWMGVPVVTLAGDRYAGRMGVSHLTSVGLAELIAASPSEYVQTAISLASDPGRMTSLRTGLRERVVNGLCNAPRFTRGLEAAYR